MKVLKITTLLILSGLFLACNHTDKKIIRYVQSVCPNDWDSCRIDLRKVLKIDYDRVYLFCEFTQSDKIASVIGIAYSSDKTIADSEWRIILLKDNEIVYEDDFPTRFMRFRETTAKIDTINKNLLYLLHYSPYYLVTRGINNYDKGYYYYLEEISNETQYQRTDYDWQKGYTFEKVTK
jgi:hypothetical protein